MAVGNGSKMQDRYLSNNHMYLAINYASGPTLLLNMCSVNSSALLTHRAAGTTAAGWLGHRFVKTPFPADSQREFIMMY
jgi:hypothetical protein